MTFVFSLIPVRLVKLIWSVSYINNYQLITIIFLQFFCYRCGLDFCVCVFCLLDFFSFPFFIIGNMGASSSLCRWSVKQCKLFVPQSKFVTLNNILSFCFLLLFIFFYSVRIQLLFTQLLVLCGLSVSTSQVNLPCMPILSMLSDEPGSSTMQMALRYYLFCKPACFGFRGTSGNFQEKCISQDEKFSLKIKKIQKHCGYQIILFLRFLWV